MQIRFHVNVEKAEIASMARKTQLSVSAPNFPIELGGAPTRRTSLYLIVARRKNWLLLKNGTTL